LVSAFAEDRNGSVWMGFWRAGLLRYDGRQFTRFKPGDGVPGGAIMALLVDHSGRLWIGSDGGGLGFLESPGRAPLRVRTYDTTSGLSSNTIVCVVEDDMGRIYAGTWKGVDRLDPKTGRTKHFSFADGLARGSFRSAFRDSSGNLWFATTQGLSRLTPVADRPPAIPTVLITDLKIFGKAYPVSPAGETIIRPPKLDPSRNQLQVEFVGFNDEPEENLRYTYKLDGAGSGWKEPPDREHEANYPGLEPGRYRFLVKAVNSEDRESTAPAEIDFVVLPPFWRRWWFEALALASLAGLFLAAHRYRVAQAVQIERMRTRIASDLHDDVGASLSRVAILTEVVKRQIGPANGDAGRMLTEIAETSRELVDGMSGIVWSIDPRHGDLQSVAFRIREFGSAVLETQNIRWDFQVPVKCQSVKLTADQRRHIFLIFKEAIHTMSRATPAVPPYRPPFTSQITG